MRLISRLLRIRIQPDSPGASTSPTGDSENTSPHRMDAEGYPAWLPQRPPPPAPASTVRSSTMDVTATVPEAGPSSTMGPNSHPPSSYFGGRRATPRSVRIVSMQDSTVYGGTEDKEGRRVPTDHTRVGSTPRVWSRATGAALSPTVFSSTDLSRLQPKFRARGLNLDLLRNPSPFARVYFYLFRVFVFVHLFLQTFFDFNAVFIIVQVAKYPSPEAPSVPGSGKNWAFGAVAYAACWFLQVVGVFLVYELLFSFVRRWRVKRPSIYPLYLSAPAFNFISVLSFRHFCFLHYLRYAGVRDGLAETFWFYAQNLPSVALLIPRAAICIALLLEFWEPQVGEVVLADAGIANRDGTFFRSDGALTRYARGVLLANAAWTAWRMLVLLFSWIGLWAVSGHGCAGFCGPRDRWEEEDAEKRISVYSDNPTLADALPWTWRESTKARIQEAYDFCLTIPRPPPKKDTPEPLEGMDQIMAAVGLGSTVPQSRRGVLTDDLFRGPTEEPEASTSGDLLRDVPYPFTTKTAQVSSDDEKVPFPPSPSLPSEDKVTTEKDTTGDADEEQEEDEDVGHADLGVVGSDRRSSGRGSGSMSSLGHPVSSRYPFHFRKPVRGTSISSNSNPRSTHSRSTGNVDSSSSHSPRSHYSTSSDAPSSPIALPPRHPNRSRSGTAPSSSPSSPVSFPSPRARTRTSSMSYGDAQPVPSSSDLEEEEEEEPTEEGDQPESSDVVGLLTLESSPRLPFVPLRARTSTPSSRSNSHSSSSRSRAGSISAIRSRTQSLIHNISATSLELVQRARADSSMARLEEDPPSGSSTGGSGGENWTFGRPMAWQRQEQAEVEVEAEEIGDGLSREYVRGQQPSPVIERDSESESSHENHVPVVMHESRSELEQPYLSTTSLSPPSVFTHSSHPDISTAAASFVTAPATIESSTTEESIRTISTIGATHHSPYPTYGPL